MITLALRRERARSIVISSLTAYENGWVGGCLLYGYVYERDMITLPGIFVLLHERLFIKTDLDGVKDWRKNWNGIGGLSVFLLCVCE